MSIENYVNKFLWTCLSVLMVPLSVPASDRYSDDPVLEFYCRQADEKQESDSVKSSEHSLLAFSRTLYKRVGSDGRITKVDTIITRLWFSNGSLDSQNVIAPAGHDVVPLNFAWPDPFSSNYLFTFYPNDPGGKDLAIGFDTESELDSMPVGIAVIDRDRYTLRRLLLHYPQAHGYKRLSRGYRFGDFDGIMFPDSLWEIGAKEGIFTTEHYRIETAIDSVKIRPR